MEVILSFAVSNPACVRPGAMSIGCALIKETFDMPASPKMDLR
jgi:hypothetical protein